MPEWMYSEVYTLSVFNGAAYSAVFTKDKNLYRTLLGLASMLMWEIPNALGLPKP